MSSSSRTARRRTPARSRFSAEQPAAITRIGSSNPKPNALYSGADVTGRLVFPAGHLASDFDAGVHPAAGRDENFPFYGFNS